MPNLRAANRSSHLRVRDWDALLQAVADLYTAPVTLDEMPIHVFSILGRLIEGDSAAYSEIDVRTSKMRGWISHIDESFAVALQHYDRIKDKYEFSRRDPSIHGGRPRLITDFMSQREYRETELYREVLHPYGVEWWLDGIMFNRERTKIITFGFWRSGRRNFSERERTFLALLQPHLQRVEELARLRTVHGEEVPLPEDLVELRISSREAEVLHWVSKGKSNGEIAIILGLSEQTIKNHLSAIFSKLGVKNRPAAILIALRLRCQSIDRESGILVESQGDEHCTGTNKQTVAC